VGKWVERLAEKRPAPQQPGTDKTDRRGLLSVLAVRQKGGEPDSQLPLMLATLPNSQLGQLDAAAVAEVDGDAARFLSRRARLLRWGWPTSEAEALAEQLARRDSSADSRVSCAECRHYRSGRCGNYRSAGLHANEVGLDLAAILQRCPGFEASE